MRPVLAMDEHDWMRDPEKRGEGLICRCCGLTEAEAEALPRMAAMCSRDWMADDEAYAEADYWYGED